MATISEIAELVGAPEPAVAYEILRVSSIEAATPVSLVFATDAASLNAALNSPAGAILTRPALLPLPLPASAVDHRLLLVADPRYAFALAARFLRSREEAGQTFWQHVHPTAVLGAGVQLGRNAAIGPHTVLGDGVVLGDDCVILANVTI